MVTETVEIAGLISIIIPAYNSAKYIERTLNNLFAQTYQNFEIIIAYDEKSTDNSLELLQKISETHPIIIDIGKDTSLGAARNRGLRLSKGEFIITVDDDDEILPDYLESLYSVYEEHPHLDVVFCDRRVVSEKQLKKTSAKCRKIKGNICLYDKDTICMLKATHAISNGNWVYLIRRKYLTDNHICWPDYSMREDYVFTLSLLEHIEEIGCYSKPLYIYIKHGDSMTCQDFRTVSKQMKPSRDDLNKLYDKLNRDAKYEWYLREKRLIASGAACSCSYNEFISVLTENGITKLSVYNSNDSVLGAVSAIVFNISKYAYYRGMRYMKKCN